MVSLHWSQNPSGLYPLWWEVIGSQDFWLDPLAGNPLEITHFQDLNRPNGMIPNHNVYQVAEVSPWFCFCLGLGNLCSSSDHSVPEVLPPRCLYLNHSGLLVFPWFCLIRFCRRVFIQAVSLLEILYNFLLALSVRQIFLSVLPFQWNLHNHHFESLCQTWCYWRDY